MLHRRIAKRYAKALIQVGERSGNTDRFAEEIDAFARLVQEVPGLRGFLANPTVPGAEKGRAFEAVLAKAEVSEDFQRFLRVLLQHQRAHFLPAMAEVYRELLDGLRGVLRGNVISAEPLSPAQLDRIRGAVAEVSGRKVVLRSRVDPDLLGGFRVELADVVLDASVVGQLQALSEQLHAGG